MLSSTTSVIVCDVDLNLDGQEFAASRREQCDADSRPRRRAEAHTTTFSTASTSGTQYGNMQQMRGFVWSVSYKMVTRFLKDGLLECWFLAELPISGRHQYCSRPSDRFSLVQK